MDIDFKTGKLRKELSEEKKLRRVHGPRRAELIMQRLAQIEAAPTLGVLRTMPGPRCHELTGNRKGQLSVDLDHPYRLLFVPNHDPVPQLAAGGMDWTKITAIRIEEIADTH